MGMLPHSDKYQPSIHWYCLYVDPLQQLYAYEEQIKLIMILRTGKLVGKWKIGHMIEIAVMLSDTDQNT